ncbi:hypothetical protein [Pseudonocardia parietis]|uniref:Uncharacterized protein n=1 Tax=Pseudonocardia parietis TaxID=570936 RepID=A0ABS4W3A5_9PSEU|nr:hypothetical protein [Pseudonocardia parietis]MBP2370680.1 hypothetical protein [Pseudonocardia parietis]
MTEDDVYTRVKRALADRVALHPPTPDAAPAETAAWCEAHAETCDREAQAWRDATDHLPLSGLCHEAVVVARMCAEDSARDWRRLARPDGSTR